MSYEHKRLRRAIVCDCAECSEVVDVTPYGGFDDYEKPDDIDAERQCPMCGKIVCESCFGNWEIIMAEEDEDSGGEYVCVECGEKLMAENGKK